MSTDSLVIVTASGWAGMITALSPLGGNVTALVVGTRELADEVAAGGVHEVRWIEPGADTPVEAYAAGAAALAKQLAPAVAMSAVRPEARALLGAVTGALGARLIPAVVGLDLNDGAVVVRRGMVSGETVVSLKADGPVAVIYDGDDDAPPSQGVAPVIPEGLDAAAVSVVGREATGSASGLSDAPRVVSFGRGVRAKDDVELIRQLAAALDAQIACSMPVADDLGWLDKDRYVGRSGNHISPQLYLAIGIAGAPQHLEGVRGARVVAALNNDPEARILRSADYGIVGDLYEVVPALIAALDQ